MTRVIDHPLTYQSWWKAQQAGTVCRRWKTFDAFLKDMGDRPKFTRLCRVDDSKPFSKSNCKWVRNYCGRYPTTMLGHRTLKSALRAAGINSEGKLNWGRDLFRQGTPFPQILKRLRGPHLGHQKRMIKFRGKTTPLVEAAHALHITPQGLRKRLNRIH